MSNFITHENPIIFLPKLAKVVGTNESLILSLIHYWINPKYNQNFKDNRFWVYNSYEQWQKRLPNLSVITIRRAINKLEKLGILVSDKLSNNSYLKVKWYSIDYDALYKIIPSELIPHDSKSNLPSDIKVKTDAISNSLKTIRKNFTCDQNEQRGDQFDQIIYNDTNNTTKNITSLSLTKTKEVIKPLGQEPEREMINIWNEVLGKDLNPLTVNSYACSLLKASKLFFARDLELWKDYLLKIASSKFLMGGGKNGWRVSFEWAVREQTIRKVLGGYYTLGDRDISYLEASSKTLVNQDVEQHISNLNPIWEEVCKRLKTSLGQDIHKAWTGKLEYLGNDQETSSKNNNDKVIRLKAPSRFIGETIKDRYICKLEEAFIHMGIKNAKIEIENSNSFKDCS